MQAMLEEDGLRFDAFLKENDKKVQEAIKRADVEAKSKQDKVCLRMYYSLAVNNNRLTIVTCSTIALSRCQQLPLAPQHLGYLPAAATKSWGVCRHHKQIQHWL